MRIVLFNLKLVKAWEPQSLGHYHTVRLVAQRGGNGMSFGMKSNVLTLITCHSHKCVPLENRATPYMKASSISGCRVLHFFSVQQKLKIQAKLVATKQSNYERPVTSGPLSADWLS